MHSSTAGASASNSFRHNQTLLCCLCLQAARSACTHACATLPMQLQTALQCSATYMVCCVSWGTHPRLAASQLRNHAGVFMARHFLCPISSSYPTH
jgi:hypothetical protein